MIDAGLSLALIRHYPFAPSPIRLAAATGIGFSIVSALWEHFFYGTDSPHDLNFKKRVFIELNSEKPWLEKISQEARTICGKDVEVAVEPFSPDSFPKILPYPSTKILSYQCKVHEREEKFEHILKQHQSLLGAEYCFLTTIARGHWSYDTSVFLECVDSYIDTKIISEIFRSGRRERKVDDLCFNRFQKNDYGSHQAIYACPTAQLPFVPVLLLISSIIDRVVLFFDNFNSSNFKSAQTIPLDPEKQILRDDAFAFIKAHLPAGSGVKEPVEEDLYSRLGLIKWASDAEVRNAYRTLALLLHPDKQPVGASEKELAVSSEAYIIIQASYDAIREERNL